MNTKMKKTIFWGGILTPMVLGIYFLLAGFTAPVVGAHGHGPGGMRPHRGFEGHPVMYGAQHDGGFSWLGFLLFLVVGIAVLALLVKWVRKKSKAASMQEFIDTSMMSSHKPIMNQNVSILDQWEKNVTKKKEND